MTTHTVAALTYQRPWLYPEQLAGIFCQERYAIIEASTKAGKTAGCMVWLTEQAMQGRAHWNYWWVAPILSQARIVFDRLRATLPRAVYSKNESVPYLTLANEARIWFKGGDNPDSLYGDDVHAAVIDEASRCKEGVWHAVRTTLTATQGPIRIIGNVKGRKNWCYKLARMAEAGADATMHYAKITAHDAVRAGVLAAAEIADAKQKLPQAVYRELYEAEPNDDGGNPFGLDAIARCTVSSLSDGDPVIWGWDLAKHVDFTVGIALDVRGRVCRFERFQKPWREIIRTIQIATGAVPAMVDASGVGDPILESLQRGEETITGKDGRTETVAAYGRFEGFKFTSASKQQLMEGLAVAIQQRQISFPAGPIALELEAFEYVYDRLGVRYSAPSGMHDDCVIALALAVSGFSRVDRHTGDDWMRYLVTGRRATAKEEADPEKGIEDHEDREWEGRF